MTAPGGLSRAAAAALAELGGAPDDAGGGVVDRAVLDVTVDGRTELVTVVLRAGRLESTCTGGGDAREHLRAALRVLAGDAAEGAHPSAPLPDGPVVDGAPARPSRLPPAAVRTTIRPASDAPNVPVLADALDHLVTSVVRAGLAGGAEAPSVEAATASLVAAAPSPTPIALARWVGRLRSAMGARDADTTARLLHGAARLVDDLRTPDAAPSARRRIGDWLGAQDRPTPAASALTDRTLVELARDCVSGLEPAAIERRYLVDVASAEVFREERRRSPAAAPAGDASVGPCPRLVSVGLGEVVNEIPPRRVRLLQYAIAASPRPEHWAALERAASRRFAPVVHAYRRASADWPGLAEPVALLAPAGLDVADGRVLTDDVGATLPLAAATSPAHAELLCGAAAGRRLRWVFGRLVDTDGVLLLMPLSAGLDAAGRTEFVRIA